MWFAMVYLFCIFSRCIFLVPGMFWDGPSVCTSSHFLSCLSADLHLGLDITSLGHRTWLHICLLLVVPVCSFGIKVSNILQRFPNLSNSFCVTYFVSSFGRPLSFILFQNWVMCLVLPTSNFGYQPSTVWKPRDYMEHTWNIHGT